ncbi:MAG: NAD(P)H-hydrate epimerase, partial [Clostridia bacterium]|nr:NAD(P)H-hydrate epimerase [Clostridia bacterium]
MRALITPAQMREMEELYFARTGTPSIDLMERAATKLCLAIQDRYGRDRKVWFACGPGGNGGDGYACARLYAKGGGRCAVVCCGMPKSADARVNRERALEAGVAVLEPERLGEAPDIWVDALYGTGLSRAPEGAAAALIGRMNADRQSAGARIVAVDIPSGLNGTDGRAFDPCVRADLTVTFQFEKTGLWLGDGLDACGEIRVADIGIPEAHHPRQMAALLEDEDVRGALPAKPRNAHKGKNGHLLIVAGSVGMAG